MSTILSKVKEIFPLLRGRTGVETLTRTTPVVLRFYKGPLRVLTYRTKVKCCLSGGVALIATRPITVKHNGTGVVTKITIAFDYPFIERIEAKIPNVEPINMKKVGTLTLEPDGCLLSLSSDSEDQV